MKVYKVEALQVYDSKGYPTVEVNISIGNEFKQYVGKAVVPSLIFEKASGLKELRDKEKKEFLGYGVSKAVTSINTFIAKALFNQDFEDIQDVDRYIAMLDGSVDRSNLGINTLLATSMAFLEALAKSKKLRFYEYISTCSRIRSSMPEPIMLFTPTTGFLFKEEVSFSDKVVVLMTKFLEYLDLKDDKAKEEHIESLLADPKFLSVKTLGKKKEEDTATYLPFRNFDLKNEASEENPAEILAYNSVSTVSEMVNLIRELKGRGSKVILKPTGHDTEDNLLSHIAVGAGVEYFMIPNFFGTEISSYLNELIRIEKHIADKDTIVL